MTCIVGLNHSGKIYIGGDSVGVNYALSKCTRTDEKVFENEDMIFGFMDSFRMGQILRYAMIHPERPEEVSDMQYLVAYWIPALIETFEDHGFHGTYNQGEAVGDSKKGGSFLMGYRGTLYSVEEDFQIGIPSDQYTAIGCGGDLAMGAMFASLQSGKKSPEKILITALEAAEKFSAGVQGPFHIVSIEDE